MTLRFPGKESREITMLWLHLYTIEECLGLNNRFCLRCLKYIVSSLLGFSFELSRKVSATDKGCELLVSV